MHMFRLPPALREGATVQVIAPSGPFKRERFDRGVNVLEKKGFVVRWDDGLFSAERYLAGDDTRRLAELQRALDDPEVDAIWAARGGYGAMRLLPELDFSTFADAPKALLGFSDITALHAAAHRAGIATFHAPVVCGLGEAPGEATDLLWRILAGETPGPLMFGATTFTGGIAEGPLLGGNLAVLSRLVGTPYLPDLEGAVLLLEDVGERPYQLDRMLTHLELAGIHEGLSGVLVGDLTACEEKDADYTALEVVGERLARWGIPAAQGFPAGHGERNFTLPLGPTITFDADRGRLDWAGPVVVD